MPKLIPLIGMLAIVAMQAHAAPIRIVALGDSITKGVRSGVTEAQTFEALLQVWLSASVTPVEVINVGIGGERTDMALLRLDTDVIALKPDYVLIMYGTNDSHIDAGKTDVRLPLEQYEQNLHTIIARLRDAGARPILMTSIPLCHTHQHAARPPYSEQGPNYRLTEYVGMCRRVAAAEVVPLVDNFAAWAEAAFLGADLPALTTDGCHPNPAGHEFLAYTIYPVLARILGGDATPPVRPALPLATPATSPFATPTAIGAVPAAPEPVDAGGDLALGKTYAETDPNTWGYGAGLTDGIKDRDAKPGVYATGVGEQYPKLTTIDLGEPQTVARVIVHNSTDGSTRTVSVSLSTDGEAFSDVGSHEFAQGDGQSFEYTCEPRQARYVRIVFEDSWLNETHGSKHFMFLREVEVFGE